MEPLSSNPIIVRASIDRQLRFCCRYVDEAFPASPHVKILVTNSGAARPLVCGVGIAGTLAARTAFHRNAFDMQQPPPFRMHRVLHAGRVQLGDWYERPALGVPIHVEQRLHSSGDCR